MYPRILQNLLKASTKLKNQRTLKTTSLIFFNVALSTEKKLPCVVPCVRARYFSSNKDSDNELKGLLPKGPMERKLFIDERAQERINELLKENPGMEKFMKVLELEIAVRRQDGERVPAKLRPRDWLELLKLKGSMQRKKYLNYLFIIEKQHEREKALQVERNLQLEQVRENREKYSIDSEEIQYGIGHNTFFRRILDSTMSKFWNWNFLKASMYGNKIIFDFGLEPFMNSREKKSCAKQILESFAVNRQHNFPFEFYFCNVDLDGELIEQVNRYIPTLFDDDFPIHITSKCYLDLFDKSNLIYLTSDAQKEMEKYDPDMVYIIGTLVDRGPKKPVSMAKAKKEGLQMYKLPLNTYMKFGDGSRKDLTLNQVVAIMLDAQENDWEKALSHVPRRKLYESRVRALERKVQSQVFFSQSEAGDTISDKLDFERKFPNIETSISQSILNQKKHYVEGKWNKQETRTSSQSSTVTDFSNAARTKLKKQWSE